MGKALKRTENGRVSTDSFRARRAGHETSRSGPSRSTYWFERLGQAVCRSVPTISLPAVALMVPCLYIVTPDQ